MHTEKYAIEGLLAFLVLGVAYALVAARFTIGPPLLVPAIAVVGAIALGLLRWRGLHRARSILAIVLMAVLTLAVGVSAVLLLGELLLNKTQAGDLLASAALLWLSNLLVFSLWYWEMDGGGPQKRHPGPHASSDFWFPQMEAGEDHVKNWCPQYLDYLFLAFNTSTAFSPTDTMILARRAKVLMMLQSLISLTTVAVLAARAINTL